MKKLIALFAFILLSGFAFATTQNVLLTVSCAGIDVAPGAGWTIGTLEAGTNAGPTWLSWTVTANGAIGHTATFDVDGNSAPWTSTKNGVTCTLNNGQLGDFSGAWCNATATAKCTAAITNPLNAQAGDITFVVNCTVTAP